MKPDLVHFVDDLICFTKQVMTVTCDSLATGKYLVVQLRGTNFLTLCEVQVKTACLPSKIIYSTIHLMYMFIS